MAVCARRVFRSAGRSEVEDRVCTIVRGCLLYAIISYFILTYYILILIPFKLRPSPSLHVAWSFWIISENVPADSSFGKMLRSRIY